VINKVGIPIALILGALIGAGSSVLTRPGVEKVKAPEKEATRLAEDLKLVLSRLGSIEKRLTREESQMSFNEAINDAAARSQLLAIVSEQLNNDQQRAKQEAESRVVGGLKKGDWRSKAAGRCREGYSVIVSDLKKKMALSADKWKGVDGELQRHFSVLEKELKIFEAGEKNSPPKINQILSASLPATLGRLRKLLSEEGAKKFDAWRLAPSGLMSWGANKADYFLVGGEYKEYTAMRMKAIYVRQVKLALPAFFKQAAVKDADRKFIAEEIDRHFDRIYVLADDKGRLNFLYSKNVSIIGSSAMRVRTSIRKKIGVVTDREFAKWYRNPVNRIGMYFGESPFDKDRNLRDKSTRKDSARTKPNEF
jgi:hypothetical protein